MEFLLGTQIKPASASGAVWLPLILLRDGRKSTHLSPVPFAFSAAAVADPLPEQERRLGVGHVGDLLGQRRIHPRTAPGGGRRPQPGGRKVMILN